MTAWPTRPFLPVMFCSMLIPGNVAGVAKQFLRCMFHQLAPNGILPQLFQSNIKGLLIPLTIKLKNPYHVPALFLKRLTRSLSCPFLLCFDTVALSFIFLPYSRCIFYCFYLHFYFNGSIFSTMMSCHLPSLYVYLSFS